MHVFTSLRAGLILALCSGCVFFAHAQLPADFYDTRVFSGFDFPTGLTFDAAGRMYIWEKKGVVHLVDADGVRLPTPFLDIQEEVANWNDHGLLGFCLDQQFAENGYCYALYALDLHHYFHFGTPGYHPDSSVLNHPTIGRVVRYQADPATGFTQVLPASKTILLGQTLANGIPLLYEFHGLGTLTQADDGTLLVSCGDATSNRGVDLGGDSLGTQVSKALELGILTPDQDLGSYRAQYLGSYNGKILRIDPVSGNGLPSNPFFDQANPRSARSRIWALGLRNPYRMVIKPHTGSHFPEDGRPGTIYVGDVGNGGWEEIDIVQYGGQNFGWPLYEGIHLNWAFWISHIPANPMAPNSLYNGDDCPQTHLSFRDLLAQPKPWGPYYPTHPCDVEQPIDSLLWPMYAELPVISWSNSMWNQPTRTVLSGGWDAGDNPRNIFVDSDESWVDSEAFDGFSSLAGVFYTANQFPQAYQGKYFGVDFSGWIKTFDFDAQDSLHRVEAFHQYCRDIIHLALNPVDGCLYYINLQGDVRKIAFGGNPAPVAVLEVSESYGPGPLTVAFDGSASYDLNSQYLTYHWDFGDGQTSAEINPVHTFTPTDSGPIATFLVRLTVTDSLGATGFAEQRISVNNSPPQVSITSFADGDQYPVDQTTVLSLRADVSDLEHGPEELQHEWRIFVHHNTHFHPEPPKFEAETFTVVSPIGCNGEDYYYRIELTVTDPEGLSTTDSRRIFPYCGEPQLQIGPLYAGAYAEGIQLTWELTDIHQPVVMEIQRSSDFFNFHTIRVLSTNNIRAGNQTFRYQDKQPEAGINFYRIKILDAQRAYRYTHLASASYPALTGWQCYPNPVQQLLNLTLEEARTQHVQLEILSYLGQRVLRTQLAATPGQPWHQEVDTQLLPSGAYYLRLIDGDAQYATPLLIQH